MLERTTRAYIEGIISKDLASLQERELVDLEAKRQLRRTSRSSKLSADTDDAGADPDACRPSEGRNMTRKTRTRRPRIPAIQSGYCAVCSVPYNNVEDHIQSKKHLKLIGEDANYIALNGTLNGFLHTSSIPFLNLNGIDAIGVHETSLDDFSPKYRRKNMPRTRAASVVCDRVVKPSPLSPTGSDVTGHHLRSRRNINYMTPPLDDDSLQEKPEPNLPIKHEMETVPREYKEYRELRSSTRALAKLTEQISDHQDEVWNSGRPKRACIKHKRVSADDRLVSDNKTYYRVEVMSSKLRSSNSREHDSKRQRSQSPRHQDEKDKGLIVKFKKLRNSELIQLNNEATNFLFPKKDDDSSENDDVDADGANTTVSSGGKDDSTLLASDAEDSKTPQKFKVEDEASMDSTCSEGKRKKRRRTHAEAFIMDNEKYYKFETPGSRLRYQGTYLSSGIKSPKHNGECTVKVERDNRLEEPREKIAKMDGNSKVVLDNYRFSFEKIPVNAPWYEAFSRLDKGEQTYFTFSDEHFWNPFILPYQMPSITPLDPKICMQHYSQIVKYLCNPTPETESSGCCSTPEPSTASTPTTCEPDLDEDSKMSAATVSSTCSLEEVKNPERKGRRRGSTAQGSGKNPRKSPRQHASTLAILSSFIHQRKRRSRNKNSDESLPTIPEEDNVQPQQEASQPSRTPKTPPKRSKPKTDYLAIARQIDDELDKALDDNLEDLEIEDGAVDFCHSKIDVNDIFRLYEESKLKEDEKSCKRFFSGTPGRKPGRRRKKNKTGWPNKNRRLVRKGLEKEKEEENDNDDSTIDSVSVNMESDDDDDDDNSTDSIKKVSAGRDASCERAERRVKAKVLTNKVTNGRNLQPYVCVQKLDSNKLMGRQCASAPKRTQRRQRRKVGSPKSPRMLRRPRGRWYRER